MLKIDSSCTIHEAIDPTMTTKGASRHLFFLFFLQCQNTKKTNAEILSKQGGGRGHGQGGPKSPIGL